MAPMMTAVELTFKPKEAMKMAKMRIHNCGPAKLMELSILPIMMSSFSLLGLMLKYFFNSAMSDGSESVHDDRQNKW
jgi:hypothetical protein